MHSSTKQLGLNWRISVALIVTFLIFTTPSAQALLLGIGGVPPAPASRREGPQHRAGDLPPLPVVQGEGV